MKRCWITLTWLGIAGCSAATTHTQSRATPQAARCDYYDYRFELDDDRRHLRATVCFDGAPPAALVCGPQGDPEHAPDAERIAGDQVDRLPSAGCRIDLATLRAGDCVRYTIDLQAVDVGFPMSFGARATDVIALHTGAFLFRPEARAATMHAHATMTLPAGVHVSVPWERDADGYLLDGSAFEQVGYAAFGTIEPQRLHTRGVTLDIATLSPLPSVMGDAIAPWMERVVDATSQLGGSFPNTRAQILLMPTAGGGGVRFGMVGRGGGPSVVFVVGRDSTLTELIESWEPAHELTHLRTPFAQRPDRWLTEGIATYYQEVLRARAGITSAAHAWKRLHTGFARGAEVGTGRSLRQESRDMYESGAFQRVYWAGAAYALMADVTLRAATNNARSLDTVVMGLQACCAQQARAWSSDEMLARMDALAERPVFTELAAVLLAQSTFPDVPTTLAALGVHVSEGDDAQLDPQATLAAVRDAIMAPVLAAPSDHTGASGGGDSDLGAHVAPDGMSALTSTR